MRYKLLYFLILFCFSARADIRFGNSQSSISLKDNGILNVGSRNFVVDGGQINRSELGNIIGNPFYFSRGIMTSYLSSSYMSGRYNSNLLDVDALKPYHDPTEIIYSILELGYNPDPVDFDFIIANPGGLRHKVYVKPGAYFLRGQPLFFGRNDIILEDETTLLAIAIQNTLNSNVILNGGILFLQDDLSLGDDSVFKNGGMVVFNNRRLSLGGKASVWDDEILWNSAFDLQLNSQTTLRGKWLFFGDGQINGNGNVIDIANGGTMIILPYSSLSLSGVKLKGLGSGDFIMGEGSSLVLSDVEIEMDADFTFDSGDLYVIGDTYVLTKDKILTFAENLESGTFGTLTVDRVALTYDPLDFVDKFNVRPLRIQDPASKFIKVYNNGSIRKPRIESISFTSYGTNSAMARYAVLWPERPMTIFPEVIDGQPQYDIVVDGKTQFVAFSSTEQTLLSVSNGVHVVYENVFFRDFVPSHLSLGQDATFVFGNNSYIRLWKDCSLNYGLIFQGNVMLRGGGSILMLEDDGEIVLKGENSTLMVEGITIKGISGNKIRCESDTSKVIMQNVKWIQDGDYTFDTGAFEILNDWISIGGYSFNFATDQICTIHSDSMMRFKWGSTLNYEPPSLNKNLLQMVDDTAVLAFEQAILSAPKGIQLTRGRLVIEKRNFAYNDEAENENEGIILVMESVLQII